MKKIISKLLFLCLSLLLLGLGSCGDKEQLSGVVGTLQYSTAACVPQDQLIRVRNENTQEAQRVIGIQIEPGTNDDKFYKLVSISINEQEETAIANLVPDIIIPPGGVMDIKVTYNPKRTTAGDELHTAYVDVVLGNPLVGVQQFALQGQAPTAKEGCGAGGGTRQFEVLEVVGILSHTANGEVPTQLEKEKDFKGNLVLSIVEDDKLVLEPEGWPEINFPLPDNTTLGIGVGSASSPVEFGGDGSLTFENMTFIGAGGAITLTGLTLTTGTITIEKSEAPNLATDSISRTGSSLDANGNMTLVVLAALPVDDPILQNQNEVKGGAFGLTLKLKEIQ